MATNLAVVLGVPSRMQTWYRAPLTSSHLFDLAFVFSYPTNKSASCLNLRISNDDIVVLVDSLLRPAFAKEIRWALLVRVTCFIFNNTSPTNFVQSERSRSRAHWYIT
jgi:hypothetical protein